MKIKILHSIITATIQQLHKIFLVNLKDKHMNVLVIIDLRLEYNILSKGICKKKLFLRTNNL